MNSSTSDKPGGGSGGLTHIDAQGSARMVDVGAKPSTSRLAIASGRIRMSLVALEAIRAGDAPKGDVLGTARIAGIMAAKRTGDLVPMCHPLSLDAVGVDFSWEADAIRVTASASLTGKTGVEMEAIVAATMALGDDLRHGQGARQGDGDRRRAADREARRQVGPLARAGRDLMAHPPPLPLEEAQARLIELAPKMPIEVLPVEAAMGRYLAAPLAALRTQPAADLSAMDGYAVREGDCAGPWTVIGESAAGHPFEGTLASGEAVRISTGALMPADAGCVVLQEDIAREGEAIALSGEGPEPPDKHVRRAGLDFRTGDMVLAAGTRIGPAQAALALSAGHAMLRGSSPAARRRDRQRRRTGRIAQDLRAAPDPCEQRSDARRHGPRNRMRGDLPRPGCGQPRRHCNPYSRRRANATSSSPAAGHRLATMTLSDPRSKHWVQGSISGAWRSSRASPCW